MIVTPQIKVMQPTPPSHEPEEKRKWQRSLIHRRVVKRQSLTLVVPTVFTLDVICPTHFGPDIVRPDDQCWHCCLLGTQSQPDPGCSELTMG